MLVKTSWEYVNSLPNLNMSRWNGETYNEVYLAMRGQNLIGVLFAKNLGTIFRDVSYYLVNGKYKGQLGIDIIRFFDKLVWDNPNTKAFEFKIYQDNIYSLTIILKHKKMITKRYGLRLLYFGIQNEYYKYAFVRK